MPNWLSGICELSSYADFRYWPNRPLVSGNRPILEPSGSHSVRLRAARLLGVIAMFSAKMTLSTAAVAMLIGTGTLVGTAGTASAYIVCNTTKDCWHTDQRAEYPAKLKAQVHPDDWYFHQTWSGQTDRNFRDYHEGNGYYLNGIWIEV
jgi:hypothetical protein